jgi:pseudo-rSAM protein
MPNGDTYANINYPSLGNIATHSIHEMLYKEMNEGKSWFRIRDQAPCNNCVYQWLCPSPSNYEMAIGRPNLCHVKQFD